MRALSLAATVTLLSACMIEAPVTESTTTQSIEAHNRLASNRLASNRLASNRLASNRLASNRLASNRLASNSLTAQILDSEEGRDVYSYIVSCALPDNMTIESEVPGADPVEDTAPPQTPYTCVSTTRRCTFPGGLGLAPRWIDHKLNPVEQRWISACLFARVNANQVAETISMRGRNEGLIVSAEELELFTAEEGAFYGNLFLDDPDPSIEPDWHACRGRAKAACPGDVGCGGLGNRDCAMENPATPGKTYCGFIYDGDCPSACRTFNADEGTYADCRAADGPGRNGNGKKYREVITTWVSDN